MKISTSGRCTSTLIRLILSVNTYKHFFTDVAPEIFKTRYDRDYHLSQPGHMIALNKTRYERFSVSSDYPARGNSFISFAGWDRGFRLTIEWPIVTVVKDQLARLDLYNIHLNPLPDGSTMLNMR